jgi:hypothetical protein
MTLLLPQPTHLLKWTMSILTDTNIQVESSYERKLMLHILYILNLFLQSTSLKIIKLPFSKDVSIKVPRNKNTPHLVTTR